MAVARYEKTSDGFNITVRLSSGKEKPARWVYAGHIKKVEGGYVINSARSGVSKKFRTLSEIKKTIREKW